VHEVVEQHIDIMAAGTNELDKTATSLG